MSIRYVHTNIIAKDWKSLSTFYQSVLQCTPVPPPRHLSGDWLERGTGVSGAVLEGEHLRLPGCGSDGPTLEIFSYPRFVDKPEPRANRLGLGHLAFLVDDVQAVLYAVLSAGGKAIGEVVSADVAGKGRLTFAYATDPEGNIIELQSWS
ncbi:MAG: VOC family protein [Syntrophobacteraceae bacterium]